MGAQAYTTTGPDDGVYSTDASWLASRLCQHLMTEKERDEIDPEWAPGMRDGSGDATASMVTRAHKHWPLTFREWQKRDESKNWHGRHGPYSRSDWVTARRFVQRCARRGVGFSLSY